MLRCEASFFSFCVDKERSLQTQMEWYGATEEATSSKG